MKKNLYTIFFMVAITVVFISALAYVNEISRDQIAANQELRMIQSMMYACNLLPHGVNEVDLPSTSTTADLPWNQESLLVSMRTRIKPVRLAISPSQREMLKKSFLSLQDSVDIYIIQNTEGGVAGYGFPLRGKGLWGTISAFGVISADLSRMIGIDFTEQVETPGLGARITESGFKYFFRGLDLSSFISRSDGKQAIAMVGTKTKSNVEESTNSIQAITGATQTCNGVINMVNTDIGFYIRLLQENPPIL